MLESLYSNARLYDAMFPQPSGLGSRAQFYLDLAATTGGPVLELGCGTGSVLLPIAERCIALPGNRPFQRHACSSALEVRGQWGDGGAALG